MPRNRSMEEFTMPISIKGYISLVATSPSAGTQARLTSPQTGGVTRE